MPKSKPKSDKTKTPKLATAADRVSLGLGAILMIFALFLSANIWVNLTLGQKQIDLTADNLYTLSDGTKDMLENLETPIHLRFFISPTLMEERTELATYASRVRGLLSSYERLSNQEITISEITATPFSPEEDRAMGSGLQAIPLSDGTAAYFGIAGNNDTDDTANIAYLAPQRELLLEYDLTEMIYRLANPEKPKIGIINSLGIEGNRMNNYQNWQIISQLREEYEIISIEDAATDFPEDIAALLVVHPRFLSDEALYNIDQYMMQGGHMIVYTDPHAEVITQSLPILEQIKQDTESSFDKLLNAYGVQQLQRTLDEDSPYGRDVEYQVVADRDAARNAPLMIQGRQLVAPHLTYLELTEDNLADDDPITAELHLIHMFSSGAFAPTDDDPITTFTPLIQSSVNSTTIDRDNVFFAPNLMALLQNFTPDENKYTMAARISGPAFSAFGYENPFADTENDTESEEAESESKEHIASTNRLSLIVVGDVDMLSDGAWLRRNGPVLQPQNNNADFLLNALSNLTGSNALLDLRGRGVSQRPLTLIAEIQAKAEQDNMAVQEEIQANRENVDAQMQTIIAGANPNQQLIHISDEDSERLEDLMQQSQDLRRQTREVSSNMTKEVDGLKRRLIITNTILIPSGIAILALLIAFSRWKRRKNYKKQLITAAKN